MTYELPLLLESSEHLKGKEVADLAFEQGSGKKTTPELHPPPFLRIPREIRDAIYKIHIEYQRSIAVPPGMTYIAKRCSACWSGNKTIPVSSDPFSLPLLFTNRQIMLEIQQTLIRKRFTLLFDCTCLLLSFLQNRITFPTRQELSRLQFHWRGEIYGYPPTPQAVLGRLQRLPALTYLSIRISQSLPLSERGRFLDTAFENASRDLCFKVADAIGFDELCSARGVEELHLEVIKDGGFRPRKSEVERLKKYLEANMKREKPAGYDEKMEVRTPYLPDREHSEIKWIGWRMENMENTFAGLPLEGF